MLKFRFDRRIKLRVVEIESGQVACQNHLPSRIHWLSQLLMVEGTVQDV